VADDPYAFLAGLSEHPNRPGDTSNFNPDFAARLAKSIREARAMGLPVGVMSGYRSDTTTGSAYDAGGNSSHGYGLASDISGLDGPNGKITQAWARIAQSNGLNNPYGAGNAKEFNHWQLPPQPLEQTPQLLARLKQARASGDFQNVWSAYGGGPTPPSSPGAAAPINAGLTVNTSPLAGSHEQFITDYAKSIGLDPKLALGIANAEGLRAWSTSNPNAASRVDVENGKPFSFGDFQLNVRNGMGADALARGIDPRDPAQWQAADRFALDQMKAGGVGPWRGDPVAAAYLKSGQTPATAPAAPATPATPATPGATLPGFTGQGASDNFLKGAQALDKAMGGKGGASAGGDGGGQAAFNPAPAHRPMAMPGEQVFGNTLTSMMTPPQWSSQSPGQAPYAGAGPNADAPIGTSLASLAQLQQLMALGRLGANPFGGGYG
jgi:hypothetical protein